MNTKTFAQQARKILIRGVKDKLRYWGFDAKGNAQDEPMPLSGGYQFRGEVYDDPTVVSHWQSLRKAIQLKGFDTVVEEAAYTWFNRMMAIRILAKNGYEPASLDFAEGAGRLPVLLQRAQRGTYPFLNETEKKRIQRLLSDYSKDAEAFAILLVGYCHSHTLLQTVFGGINDYTELLLPDDMLAEEGFLNLLNTTDAISDEEYRKVELIGWLYQFYISEKKDEIAGFFTEGKKVEVKDLPAATQIFTPNWIVKYMVQNTVGKIWLDLYPNSPLKTNMKYLVESDPVEYGEPIISEIAQLKLLDPAAGSGHILVEGFDLLFEMYLAEYYPPEEAAESILRHNLYGLDIDKRAAQLAQFAVLLKAAARYPDVLKKGIRPHIYAMPEPHDFSRQDVLDFLGKDGISYADQLFDALHLMQQAQNLGSVMKFELPELAVLHISQRWRHFQQAHDLVFQEMTLLPALSNFLPILLILCSKYEAVVANPPYMGRKWMNIDLANYIDGKYTESKSDLMTVFIEVCINIVQKNGYSGVVTLDSWMFLPSFENLREIINNYYRIDSLIHIGWNTFPHGHLYNRGVAFCLRKNFASSKGAFINLSNVEATVDKHNLFLVNNRANKNKFYKSSADFIKIPGNPIAYWVSDKMAKLFNTINSIGGKFNVVAGISTGANSEFIYDWFEISFKDINFNKKILSDSGKYTPHNKGGESRKWYGNTSYVLKYNELALDIMLTKKGFRYDGKGYFFQPSISWGKVTSSENTFRMYPSGFTFDSAGISIFSNEKPDYYLLAFLNTNLAKNLLKIINPTLNASPGVIKKLPYPVITDEFGLTEDLIKKNVIYAKKDWDSRESSWDFQYSPFLNNSTNFLKALEAWQADVTQDFFHLHANEEELNRIFIDIYGLQDELTPEVPLKDITILQEELSSKDLEALEQDFRKKGKEGITMPIRRDVVMQQFISYLVGICMGRYRLDRPGLHIAHPNPSEAEIQPYPSNGHTVEIDEDAILPLMGSESEFPDDALQRIKQLLDTIWGADTRTENINFLQECLDMDLEKYLVKHFWKDHCKRYKKKPIYWLFSSEGGAFQVLVYMHRMNAFTVERIREKYLLPHIKHLRGKISLMDSRAAQLNSLEARQLDRFRKDLLECEQFEMEIKGFADHQIVFDLDDGVTVNYGLFEGVVAAIK